MNEEIDDVLIDKLDSEPGLKAALQTIGHAGMKAQENGRCVIELTDTSNGLQVLEITDHVATLEGENE